MSLLCSSRHSTRTCRPILLNVFCMCTYIIVLICLFTMRRYTYVCIYICTTIYIYICTSIFIFKYIHIILWAHWTLSQKASLISSLATRRRVQQVTGRMPKAVKRGGREQWIAMMHHHFKVFVMTCFTKWIQMYIINHH